MAVTGTYFEPYNDWPGGGPRPLIVYGPGTQGQGDQCAPSRQFNQGIHWRPYLDLAFNYEELFVSTMVARGFAIVMTDYQGLGTPGLHTYVGRVPQGDAMLDAARAAKRLPGHVAGSRWARCVLGLLAGRRGGGVGGRTGVVVRAGAEGRRHLCRRAAGRSQGTVPLRRRQRPGRRRRLCAQLGDHGLSRVRRRDPREADAARRGLAVTRCRTSASPRRSRNSCSGTCSRTSTRTSTNSSTRNRSAACSTSRSSAASNPMRR